MAITHEIKVERRTDEGKGASRRLRHAAKIPAIVYGGSELKPVSIQIEHEAIWLASQHEWFYSSILDLSLGGDVQKVLLRLAPKVLQPWHPRSPALWPHRWPQRRCVPRPASRCACALSCLTA